MILDSFTWFAPSSVTYKISQISLTVKQLQTLLNSFAVSSQNNVFMTLAFSYSFFILLSSQFRAMDTFNSDSGWRIPLSKFNDP